MQILAKINPTNHLMLQLSATKHKARKSMTTPTTADVTTAKRTLASAVKMNVYIAAYQLTPLKVIHTIGFQYNFPELITFRNKKIADIIPNIRPFTITSASVGTADIKKPEKKPKKAPVMFNLFRSRDDFMSTNTLVLRF